MRSLYDFLQCSIKAFYFSVIGKPYRFATRCLILSCLTRFLNAIDMDWDLFPVVMQLAYPKVVKILDRLLMMVFVLVVFDTDMTGNLAR